MTSTLEVAPSESAGEVILRSAPDGRLLVITDNGPVAVRLRQCFPWSQPSQHLSLRDAADREIALIEDPATLDGESRRALDEALAAAGFVLEVTRVVTVDEEVEIRQWTVETTHGRR